MKENYVKINLFSAKDNSVKGAVCRISKDVVLSVRLALLAVAALGAGPKFRHVACTEAQN